MRWALFFICILLFVARLLAASLGWASLRPILFYATLVVAVLNAAAWTMQVNLDLQRYLPRFRQGLAALQKKKP